MIPYKREARHDSIEKRKTELIKELTVSGIDPDVFDRMLSNETDRRMKRGFGILFLVLTVVFTGVSYAIVVCDAIKG